MRIERPGTKDVLPEVTGQPSLNMPTGGLTDLASSLTEGLQDATALYAEVQQDQAQAEAQEAVNNFLDKTEPRLFDPTTGYFTTEGKTAYKKRQEVMEDIKKAREEFASGLSKLAADYFWQETKDYVDQVEKNVDQHAFEGLEAWRQVEWQNYQDRLVSRAVHFGENPEQFSALIDKARNNIIDWGKSHRWSEEQIMGALDSTVSTMLRTAISGAIARGDTETAVTLYESNKKQLLAEDYLQITQEISQLKERQEAVNTANRALSVAHQVIESSGSLTEALENAAGSGDAQFVEQVRQNIVDIRQRQEQAEDFAAAQAYHDFLVFRSENPNMGLGEVISARPELWSSLSAKQQAELKGQVAHKRKLENYFAILAMPKEKAAEKLSYTEATSLVPTDKIEKTIEYLRDVKEGSGPEQPEDVGPLSPELSSQVTALVTRMYGPPDERTEAEAQKAQVAFRIADSMARQLSEDGRLTTEDAHKILDAIGMDTKVKDVSDQILDLNEKTDVVSLKSIPADKQQQAIQTLEEKGLPITEKNVTTIAHVGVSSPHIQEQLAEKKAIQTLEEKGLPITEKNVTTIAHVGVSSPHIQEQLAAKKVIKGAGDEVTEDKILFYAKGQLPEGRRDTIVEFLREQGKPVTKANIYNVYFQVEE